MAEAVEEPKFGVPLYSVLGEAIDVGIAVTSLLTRAAFDASRQA
jgi:hypothetical protein